MQNLWHKLTKKNFFISKQFLVIVGFSFIITSVYLWKSQEKNNLDNLSRETRSVAIAHANETEIEYNRIKNALTRLANRGAPNSEKSADDWKKDAIFYLDAFAGIKNIAWVDKDFSIQMIVPIQSEGTYVGKSVSEIVIAPSDVSLLEPVYEGTELKGFIFGEIDIATLIEPVINDIGNNFAFQLSKEKEDIFTSPNWVDLPEAYHFIASITFQNTTVLNMDFIPTEANINSEINQARETLIFSLLFSLITIIAIYYAQKFNELSELNEARFRELLEEVDLIAVMIDYRGVITFCNDYLLALTGWERKDILNRNWFDRFIPNGSQAKAEFQNKFKNDNISAHEEITIVTRTGEKRSIMLNNTMLRDTRKNNIGVASLAEDITHRKISEAQIKRQIENLTALQTIDQAISSNSDIKQTLNIALKQVTNRLEVDAANILLRDPHTQRLEFFADRGPIPQEMDEFHQSLGDGFVWHTILKRSTLVIYDLSTSHQEREHVDLLTKQGFVAYACAPLLTKGDVIGVLEVFGRKTFRKGKDWLDFFETLAAQIAIAIDSARLFTDLQRSNIELQLAYDATIEGWSRALDLRDKETEGHTQRVTKLTLIMAKKVGLSKEELVHVRRGALLHDIGKMGIPDSILHKPGPLTDEEWVIMRKHPQYAFEMLSPISYLRPALDIPGCHHEKWDGSGYPRGLIGKQIPLEARIFALIDVYDALTSDRPYRKAWSKEKAISYMRDASGSHFDPNLVPLFFEIIDPKD